MTPEPLVVGVDLSTTACKAIAWDAAGRSHGEGRAPLRLENPEPDGWEQDAESWGAAAAGAVSALTRALGPRARDVRALAIANQRETVVVTDDAGRALHPALSWMDSRCRREVAALVDALGADRLHAVSGKPPCTTPSIYKLAWLFGTGRITAARRALRVLDVHAWLVHRWTGRFATSVPAADPLGLVDLASGTWSAALLDALGLDDRSVPELRPPGEVLGELRPEVARAVGLPAGVRVVAGAGDGQAAGLGTGIEGRREAYLNLGTALVCGVACAEPRTSRAFRTLAGATPGTFFLETDLRGGMFTLTWLAELLGGAEAARERMVALDDAATRVPPGAEGLLLVPYWHGVMNPYWDDAARGAVVGLHGGHGPAHLHRAALEGLALEQRLHLEGVDAALGERVEELRAVGGGARSELFVRIVADVTGRRVVAAADAEASALGAAMLAAVGVGLHPSTRAAMSAMVRLGAAVEPGAASALYDDVFARYRRVYPALAGAGLAG
ncbi:MAG: xylulose kinase [Polyangiaceae bacterium]|nr:xylulose kinase [Polyangiaceae bacterium]